MSGSQLWKCFKFELANLELKENINDEDLMIHVIDNFPDEYVIILVVLENHHRSSDPNAMVIEVICKKMNHQLEKI